MSRIALTGAEVRRKELRRQYIPLSSIIFGCLLALLPIVVSYPVVPDFAFLLLVAWRLLRPELWRPTIALPLGLFNDLVAGHPIGQSMAIWTIAFLAFDLLDSRLLYRDYWMDWFFASLAIVFAVFGDWFIAREMGSRVAFLVMLPQLVASVFAYPIVARIVLGLDRWRLSR